MRSSWSMKTISKELAMTIRVEAYECLPATSLPTTTAVEIANPIVRPLNDRIEQWLVKMRDAVSKIASDVDLNGERKRERVGTLVNASHEEIDRLVSGPMRKLEFDRSLENYNPAAPPANPSNVEPTVHAMQMREVRADLRELRDSESPIVGHSYDVEVWNADCRIWDLCLLLGSR